MAYHKLLQGEIFEHKDNINQYKKMKILINT